jgi:acetyltransferase-like isoleucine patch superfamily enzyme
VVIGDRVQIGTGVSLLTAGHDTSILSRQKFVEFGHPIFVEDDCWFGANVVILPGNRIGKGSKIGAGSIVTKDIPPFSVAVGTPCRVKKTIQSAEEEVQDRENPYRHLSREH